MANLQDIAKESGFSTATVSRILNQDSSFHASDATRKKVLAVAERQGYVPNPRGAKEQPLLHFGFFQMYHHEKLESDPYYWNIQRQLEQLQETFHFRLSPLDLNQQQDFTSPQPLDGIFAIGIFSPQEIEKLKVLSPHLVFLDSSPDNGEFYGVIPDFRQAVDQALSHFLERGHKKIGFIGERFVLGDENQKKLEPRTMYFESFLRPLGLYHPEYHILAHTSVSSGYEATKAFLAQGTPLPTAFFLSSDSCANGVMRAFVEAGLKIPQDISLIAFNNTVLSEYTLVPLTAVGVSPKKMANMAVKHLLDAVSGVGFPLKSVIPSQLFSRESVFPLLVEPSTQKDI